MNSLSDLNGYGSSSLEFTDPRSATVIFTRAAPLQSKDQILNISSTTVSVSAGTDIAEIINYSTANVRYQVEIKTTGSPLLTGSTISWGTLPSGVSLTTVGNVYTLSGINSVALWRQIKNFTWNLPVNYASSPTWYLEVNVIYYDEDLAEDVSVGWRVFDLNYYTVSTMTSTSTLSFTGINLKLGEAHITGGFSPSMDLKRLRRSSASLSLNATLVGEGQINADNLFATSSLTSKLSFNPGNIKANITASVNVVCNGILVISNMYPRTYTSEQENQIFASDPPQIDDTNPGSSNWTITFSSSIGTFSNSSTVWPVSPYSYTGTLSQVNSVLSNLRFYPTGSSNGTISYTQQKDGVTQLTRTINLTGSVGNYTSRNYTFTSSQLWIPNNEDLLYSSTHDALIVGGGGGGSLSGGGGGGGVREEFNLGLTSQTYSLVVGTGGAPTNTHPNWNDMTSTNPADWVNHYEMPPDVGGYYIRSAGGSINYYGFYTLSVNSSTGLISITTIANHGFTNGQLVTIRDVTGMTALNNNTYYVNVISSNTVTLYSNSGLTSIVDGRTMGSFYADGYCIFDYRGAYYGVNANIRIWSYYSFGFSVSLKSEKELNPHLDPSGLSEDVLTFSLKTSDRSSYLSNITANAPTSVSNPNWTDLYLESAGFSGGDWQGWTADSDWIPVWQSLPLPTSKLQTYLNYMFVWDSKRLYKWVGGPSYWEIVPETGDSSTEVWTSTEYLNYKWRSYSGLLEFTYNPADPDYRPLRDGAGLIVSTTLYIWTHDAWIASGYTSTGGWTATSTISNTKYYAYAQTSRGISLATDAPATYSYCDIDSTPYGSIYVINIGTEAFKASSGGNSSAFGYTSTGGEGGEDFNYSGLADGYCRGGNSGIPAVNNTTAYTGATSYNVLRGAGGAGAGHNGYAGSDYDGGSGKLSTITGQYYGGGGGGATNELVDTNSWAGEGGLGGGGDGAAGVVSSSSPEYHPSEAGESNTGGGGGAGYLTIDDTEYFPPWYDFFYPKSGGSGVIVVRFNA